MKPRALIVLVAALALAALTARLGWWQLDRAAQKLALQDALQRQRALPALAQDDLARTPERAAQQQHRLIELQGHWLVDRSVYLDNRPMNGHVGFYAVTPLALADGSAVLVQRGWLPRDMAERTRIAAPHTPPGVVAVRGRIAASLPQWYELGAAASGAIRQNLGIEDFARETGLPLRPLAIVQEDGATPESDGLLRQWTPPASDVHKHYGYAFQWFALCALTLGLYAWFQLIQPHRGRHVAPG